MLNIILNSSQDHSYPFITLLGFVIAMVWLFTRKSKKNNKDKEQDN